MSEVSQDKLAIMDVKKIRVAPDGGSFSGYSIMAMDKESQGLPGIPASPFEVVMWHEIERLRKEKQKLRMFIEKVYDIGNNTDYVYAAETMLEMLKPVASSEDLPVAS